MAATNGNGSENDEVMERIESEELDSEVSPVRYEINVFPADFTLEGLNQKMLTKEIKLPPFQRSYVWTIKQASRLIESFLIGLPVPPIFLYVEDDGRYLIVDGQQRLRTIQYFFEGYFGEPVAGKRQSFQLTGLNERSPYANKTKTDILDSDEARERRFRNTVLRSVIIKQLDPKDDTSIYHIFERLNTGGTPLKGQEIRTCIYHGAFNDLLHELNKGGDWRKIFGKNAPDKRQRDIELILRFFALHYDSAKYEKPMKDFLSTFMGKHKSPSEENLRAYREIFEKTSKAVVEHLGEKPFRLHSGLNAAIFDAVFSSFASHVDKVPKNIKKKYTSLIADEGFKSLVATGTTDEDVVAKRLAMANQRLFGR